MPAKAETKNMAGIQENRCRPKISHRAIETNGGPGELSVPLAETLGCQLIQRPG
jgi:hypothetical protein